MQIWFSPIKVGHTSDYKCFISSCQLHLIQCMLATVGQTLEVQHRWHLGLLRDVVDISAHHAHFSSFPACVYPCYRLGTLTFTEHMEQKGGQISCAFVMFPHCLFMVFLPAFEQTCLGWLCPAPQKRYGSLKPINTMWQSCHCITAYSLSHPTLGCTYFSFLSLLWRQWSTDACACDFLGKPMETGWTKIGSFSDWQQILRSTFTQSPSVSLKLISYVFVSYEKQLTTIKMQLWNSVSSPPCLRQPHQPSAAAFIAVRLRLLRTMTTKAGEAEKTEPWI